MSRIFASLAIAECILLAGAGAIGFFAEDLGSSRHIVLAVFALILSCMIQVVAFTYLTVTGKMIVQAVHLGDLSLDPIREAKKLKRSWTWLLGLIVILVVVVTASGSQFFHQGNWYVLHVVSAASLFAAHVLVFYLEYDLIHRNQLLMARTMDAYADRRKLESRNANGGNPSPST